MSDTYILFEVDGATYAVSSAQVERVEMVESIARVPNAPGFVEGVTAIHGQVIPVVGMRRRFQAAPAPLDLRARLVVIRLEERLIGMLVDSAREFTRISADQVKPPPEALTGPVVDYLDGVVVLPNRLLLLVNLRRLFTSQEREELAGAMAEMENREAKVRPGGEAAG